MSPSDLEARIAALIAEQQAILNKADTEDRAFTNEECIRLDELKVLIDSYQRRLSGQ